MRQAVARRPHARRLRPPRDASDVLVVRLAQGRTALDAGRITALLREASVFYPEPSTRTPMAFALTRRWVLKANLRRRSRDAERAFQEAGAAAALHARLGLWHPAKTWFVLRERGRFLPGNATPRLHLLSEMPLRALFEWQRLRLVWRAAQAGYRLDARGVNFGRAPGSLSLYYLDDEIYPLRK